MVDAGWIWIAFVAGLLVQLIFGRAIIKEYKLTIIAYKDVIHDLKKYREDDKATIAWWQRSNDFWKAKYADAADLMIIDVDSQTTSRMN